MKQPYLSIIIPAYNSWNNVFALLTSVKKSSFKNVEIIIGDDASHTEKPMKLLRLLENVHITRLSINSGPAAARNAAAKLAKGKILVFLDSDVTVYPDTLGDIVQKFADDRDLTALTGVWDKHQKTRAFFPQFKALRDWSYWINERDRNGYYYLFSTRIAAIKRDVFLRLGGFNEDFRQMEDVEITYRIARRYAIIFAPDVRVHHEFEGFWIVARKYFWRSFYWTRLYRQRKKFDPVATTVWESVTAVTGVGLVIVFFLLILASLSHLSYLSYLWGSLFVLLFIHVFLLRKFLFFVFKEKGIVFMIQSFFTGIALYCVIAAGSLYFIVR